MRIVSLAILGSSYRSNPTTQNSTRQYTTVTTTTEPTTAIGRLRSGFFTSSETAAISAKPMNVTNRTGVTTKKPEMPISGGIKGRRFSTSTSITARTKNTVSAMRSPATITFWVPPVSLAPMKLSPVSKPVIISASHTCDMGKTSAT